jgi:serine phosphatase RsbU (regulator of sigma subunit)
MILGPDGSVTVAESPDTDLLLGFDPTTQRGECTLTIEAGATVLLYTDGLVERRGQSLGDGLEYLRQTLAELAADGPCLEDLCDRLLERMLPDRRDDDVALAAVRLRHHERKPR